MSIDGGVNELYSHCQMCQTVAVQGIRMELAAYVLAGGDLEKLTTGICQDRECREEYVLYASNGDACITEMLRKGLL